MTINLSDYESGDHFDGDYDHTIARLEKRLARIQVAHIVRGKRAIVMFEGWDAAGKGGIIQRLTSGWDPRNFEVWPIKAPSEAERDRHFLWRFWQRLPADGSISIFDRSWYGRVLVERVEGYASEKTWRHGYDEINAFEAQQVESGTTIVKLFVHISQKTQDKRLAARLDDPWKRWKTGLDDYRNRARRDEYLDAMHDMFRHTDTHHAPWHVIDGNRKKPARIAALTLIADALEAAVDMTPPALDPEVAKAARAALEGERP